MVHVILYDQSYVACAAAMADTNKCHSGMSSIGDKKVNKWMGRLFKEFCTPYCYLFLRDLIFAIFKELRN